MKTMAMKWMARLVRFKWLRLLKKVGAAFSPGLAKLGEVLVVSGAAALGLKGADSSFTFMSFDLSRVDGWWAVATVLSGLVVWALATYFRERKPREKQDE